MLLKGSPCSEERRLAAASSGERCITNPVTVIFRPPVVDPPDLFRKFRLEVLEYRPVTEPITDARIGRVQPSLREQLQLLLRPFVPGPTLNVQSPSVRLPATTQYGLTRDAPRR